MYIVFVKSQCDNVSKIVDEFTFSWSRVLSVRIPSPTVD